VIVVAAIGAVSALGNMASLGSLSAVARNGRPLAVGAAATTGNQLPARRIPKQAPEPMPSTEVRISDAGRKALADASLRSVSRPSFIAVETAALARANRVPLADVGVAGSVSNLGIHAGAAQAGRSEVAVSDQVLMSLILALLAEVRDSANAPATMQASQRIASQ
jgi:hypothetical protein